MCKTQAVLFLSALSFLHTFFETNNTVLIHNKRMFFMFKTETINPYPDNVTLDKVEKFFADENTTPNADKPHKRKEKRLGERTENIHMKKLINNGANVERIEKANGKPYHKLSIPEVLDDGKTKAEIKKECNRNIRHSDGILPKGTAYKKGSEVIHNDECNNEDE